MAAYSAAVFLHELPSIYQQLPRIMFLGIIKNYAHFVRIGLELFVRQRNKGTYMFSVDK